jgi:dihydrofolate reductase
MIISLVAAAAENNIIGKENALPWRLPADLKFFKNLTMGHSIIMGRKTFQSVGKALPGRKNIIITRDNSFSAEDCIVLGSLSEAFQVCKDEDEIFVVGGAEIYHQSMEFADKIYLTRVHALFAGDTYFPDIHEDEWRVLSKEEHRADEKNIYPYSFIQYLRIKN